MNTLVNDIDVISDGLLQGFTQLFTGVITIVGTLGFMLSIHPGITLGKLNEMIMDSVDLVIVLWDGKSRGTRRILQYVRKQKIPCHLYIFISDYPGDPGAIALRAEFL